MTVEAKIPDKLTFRRKEVMQLAKLDGRVLDFWEREFAAFAPVVNQSGEKFYSRHDLEVILAIQRWLVVEKRDKAKVRDLLRQQFDLAAGEAAPAAKGAISPDKLQKIRRGLDDILTLLAKGDKT